MYVSHRKPPKLWAFLHEGFVLNKKNNWTQCLKWNAATFLSLKRCSVNFVQLNRRVYFIRFFKLNRNLWLLHEIQFCYCHRSFYMIESKHVSIHICFYVLYVYEICNISTYNLTNSWFFSWSLLMLLQSLTLVSTGTVMLSVTELGDKGVGLVKWPLSEIMLDIAKSPV